jgi:hypothetical protein
MKTMYEISMEKNKGRELEEFLKSGADSLQKSKKKDLNIV